MDPRGQRFRAYLFADQDLDELLAGIHPPGGELAEAAEHLRIDNPEEAEVTLAVALATRPDEASPWHHLLLAGARLRRGDRDRGVESLRQAVAGRDSRVALWGARALRDIDAASFGDTLRVRGAIVEVHVEEGLDTLAVYDDGTARYLHHTGAKIVWDAPDGSLAGVIDGTIRAAQAAAPHIDATRDDGAQRDGVPLVAGDVRVTILCHGGARGARGRLTDLAHGAGPAAEVFGAATALLGQLLTIARW